MRNGNRHWQNWVWFMPEGRLQRTRDNYAAVNLDFKHICSMMQCVCGAYFEGRDEEAFKRDVAEHQAVCNVQQRTGDDTI